MNHITLCLYVYLLLDVCSSHCMGITGLENLGPDTVGHICTYLEPRDIAHVSLTSRAMRILTIPVRQMVVSAYRMPYPWLRSLLDIRQRRLFFPDIVVTTMRVIGRSDPAYYYLTPHDPEHE